MPAPALVDLDCPHCHQSFVENAKLVRPGGTAWCPECGRLFDLSDDNEALKRTLAQAKLARRERRERLSELQLRWTDIPAQQASARLAPGRPMLMTDVLSTLDNLLDRLDTLHRRRT